MNANRTSDPVHSVHTDHHETLVQRLAVYNLGRLKPGIFCEDVHRLKEERNFVETLRDEVAPLVPTTKPSYEEYEALLTNGPGQGDRLFPWLATTATRPQMEWFLGQEAAGEVGFGDLVAMTSVKMPPQVKLEMARNYWDEMGRGHEQGMHDKLLHDLLGYMGLTVDGLRCRHSSNDSTICTVPESLQLANLMMALACHRCYAFLSVGALGVIEMTAPGRVKQVDEGLARLGVPSSARQYFTLHGTLDIKHSREWNREVILPLWPEHGRELLEGALLRLWCGARCYDRYRLELGVA